MIAPVSRPPAARRLAWLVAAAAAAALAAWAPSSAHAQFGKILKKATDKVAPKNPTTASGPAPTYDQTMLELTPERLAKVIDGLTAMRGVLVGGSGGESIAALVKQRDDANDQLSAIENAHNKDLEAYQRSIDKTQQCRDEAISASQDQHRQQAQARLMTDPSIQQKYVQAAQAMAAANAKGDTAAMRKIQLEMQQSAYPYAKDDTAAADSKCGKAPVQPAWYVQRDKLMTQVQQLSDRIRATHDKADAAGKQASGLTAEQFAMAHERLDMYIGRKRGGSNGQVGFSQVELDAIAAKISQIEQLNDDINKASMT